jgi:transcriptional regulator with XRE-family HTH domain
MAKAKKRKEADVIEARRDAFRQWLERNHLNANTAAKRAGIAVSGIYNFLNGDTKSLSANVLSKLAEATSTSVDSILGGAVGALGNVRTPIKITYRIGARGSMFLVDENLTTAPPQGVSLPEGVSAAVVDGESLGPIPPGWTVFFRDEPTDPEHLIGKPATVRYAGGGDRPAVLVILKSKFEGLHSLRAMDGTLIEDVKILAAHEIVSFALTEISQG